MIALVRIYENDEFAYLPEFEFTMRVEPEEVDDIELLLAKADKVLHEDHLSFSCFGDEIVVVIKIYDAEEYDEDNPGKVVAVYSIPISFLEEDELEF